MTSDIKKKVRLFVSYRQDEADEFVSRLHTDLENRFLALSKANEIDFEIERIFVDIKTPTNGQLKEVLGKEIKETTFFLLIYTPGVHESENCLFEWAKAIEYAKPIIPILYKTEWESLTEVDFFNETGITKEIAATVSDETYSDFLSKFIERLKIAVRDYRPAASIEHIPRFGSYYYHRKELLTKLRNAVLQESGSNKISPIFNIYGDPYSGKTGLARELVNDYQVRRVFTDGICWIDCRKLTSTSDKWEHLQKSLGLDVQSLGGRSTSKAEYIADLTRDKRYLFIFDNLDKPSKQFLKAFERLGNGCRLVITSRNELHLDMISFTGIDYHRVSVLSEGEAINFLSKQTGIPKADLPEYAYKLAERLNSPYLLLQITQHIIELNRQNMESLWKNVYERVIGGGLIKIYEPINLNISSLEPDLQELCWQLVIFKEDSVIPLNTIQKLWGTNDTTTKKYINILLSKQFLLENGDNSYILYSLFAGCLKTYHDTATTQLSELHKKLLNKYNPSGKEGNWHVLARKDEYLSKNLAYHLKQAQMGDNLFELLTQSKLWTQLRYENYNFSLFYDDIKIAKTCFTHDDIHKQVLLYTSEYHMDQLINGDEDIDLAIQVLSSENDHLSIWQKILLRKSPSRQFDGGMAIYSALGLDYFTQEVIEKLEQIAKLQIEKYPNKLISLIEVCIKKDYYEKSYTLINELKNKDQKIARQILLVKSVMKNIHFDSVKKTHIITMCLPQNPITTDSERVLYILCRAYLKENLAEIYAMAQDIQSIEAYIDAMQAICEAFTLDTTLHKFVRGTLDTNKQAYASFCLSIYLRPHNDDVATDLQTLFERQYDRMTGDAETVIILIYYMAELAHNHRHTYTDILLEDERLGNANLRSIKSANRDDLYEKLALLFSRVGKTKIAIEIAQHIITKKRWLACMVNILFITENMGICDIIENDIRDQLSDLRPVYYKEVIILLSQQRNRYEDKINSYKLKINPTNNEPAWGVLQRLLLKLFRLGMGDIAQAIINKVAGFAYQYPENIGNLAITLTSEGQFDIAKNLATRLTERHKLPTILVINALEIFYKNDDGNTLAIEEAIQKLLPSSVEFERDLANNLMYQTSYDLLTKYKQDIEYIFRWLGEQTDKYYHAYQLIKRLVREDHDSAQAIALVIPTYNDNDKLATKEISQFSERKTAKNKYNDTESDENGIGLQAILDYCKTHANNLREFVIEFLACYDVFGDEGYDSLCDLIKFMTWADEHTPFWKDVYSVLDKVRQS